MKKRAYSTCQLRVVRLGTVLCAALVTVSVAQAQYTGPTAPQIVLPGNADGISQEAKEFMQDAAQANQTEIAMAKVAEARSQNTAVKELAKMMRTDHQQNYDLLQVMAQNHLFVLDSTLNSMNQRAVNRLQASSDASESTASRPICAVNQSAA